MMMMTMVLLKTVFVQHIAHESACEAVLESLALEDLRMVNSSLGDASLVAMALRTISKATFLDEPTLDTRVVRKGTCKCLGFWVVLQRTTAKDPVMRDHLREEVSVLRRWQLVIRQIWMLLDGPHLIRVPKAILESVILRDAANDRAEARSHGRHFHSPAITRARTRRGALSGSANDNAVAGGSSHNLPLPSTRRITQGNAHSNTTKVGYRGHAQTRGSSEKPHTSSDANGKGKEGHRRDSGWLGNGKT